MAVQSKDIIVANHRTMKRTCFHSDESITDRNDFLGHMMFQDTSAWSDVAPMLNVNEDNF